MPKVDTLQSNFTAGEISPKLKGRTDIARYQNGADAIENGIPVVHGGIDRRDGSAYLAAAKFNEDKGVRLIGYIYNTDQSYMLEFGHQYIRFFTNTGAVILNPGLTPLELVSPFTRDQLFDLNYRQSNDTMLIWHPDVPTQRLRRLSSTTWSIEPVPWITEPFEEIGHVPDSTLTVSSIAVGAGRSFVAGALSAPGAPTIGAVTPLNAAVNVAFTAPGSTGGAAITQYTATSSPGGFTGVGTGSPVRVSGLTNGVAYTFTVTATNIFGTGAASAASASATPLSSLPGALITATAAPLDSDYAVGNGGVLHINGPIAAGHGGIGPYAYAWTKLSGFASVVIETANAPRVVFRSSGTNRETYAAFRCTVTDVPSGVTATVDVSINVVHGVPTS